MLSFTALPIPKINGKAMTTKPPMSGMYSESAEPFWGCGTNEDVERKRKDRRGMDTFLVGAHKRSTANG
jgi:hypothetical protein